MLNGTDRMVHDYRRNAGEGQKQRYALGLDGGSGAAQRTLAQLVAMRTSDSCVRRETSKRRGDEFDPTHDRAPGRRDRSVPVTIRRPGYAR